MIHHSNKLHSPFRCRRNYYNMLLRCPKLKKSTVTNQKKNHKSISNEIQVTGLNDRIG